MRKIYFAHLLVVALFFAIDAHGQSWLWGRGATGGQVDAWPVATDPSGNVFVAGMNCSNFIMGGTAISPTVFGSSVVPFSTASASYSGVQCIIAKYDLSGVFLWAVGTQNADAKLINIATDKNGNSFMFGALNSLHGQIGAFTLTNSIYPQSQYFLAKFGPAGNVLWARNDGNTDGDVIAPGIAVGTSSALVLSNGGITSDDSGNVYVTTAFRQRVVTVGTYTLVNTDTSGNTHDILLAKYDAYGNVVWAASAGGTADDQVYCTAVTPAGSVYIAGTFISPSLSFGPSVISYSGTPIPLSGGGSYSQGNAFIARYNASGAPYGRAAVAAPATNMHQVLLPTMPAMYS